MSDIVTGVRQVIQDLVAPDLKANGAKLDALEKQLDLRTVALEKQLELHTSSLQKQIEMLQKHSDAQYETLVKSANLQYEALLKALDGLRAEMRSGFSIIDSNQQLEIIRHIAPISERVAALEARQKPV